MISNRPKIIKYKGRSYRLTKGSYGTWYYIWRRPRGRAAKSIEEFDKNETAGQRYLHVECWKDHNPGIKIPDGLRVVMKDPDGDPTDIENLQVLSKHAISKSQEQRSYRAKRVRQLTRDTVWGYVKICLGCSRHWTILESDLLYEIFPAKKTDFPCEPRCVRAKANYKQYKGEPIAWEDLPHAPGIMFGDIEEDEEDFDYV
jgi:hypothetical protein